jgi:hypothetical protein
MGYTDARAHLVWAYGFRNPWSFHIDPVTGDLFIGDVGASEYEEIDWAREPGLNFGWAWYEGPQAYAETCTVPGSDFVFPIHSYDRRDFEFGAAVVSAGLYRRHGPDGFPPGYDGDYFFSDFGAGFIRRLERDGDEWRVAPMGPGQPGAVDWAIGYWHVSHFLEGPDGALWYLAYGEGASGQIGRIVYRGVTAVGEAAGDDIGLATRPLPTRGPLVVSFSLSQPSSVTLSLFDVHGRRVRIVEAGGLGPGRHDLRWDGRDQTGAPVMAGLYYLQLRAGARSWTRRIPVVR